jgi:hypothetical protein
VEPLAASGLKVALPALRAGFKAVQHELARSPSGDGTLARLGDIDNLLDEAIAVLAREADSLRGAAAVRIKGLLSRPTLFDRSAPMRWIATELAQECLKQAVRAAIRGEDDTAFAAQAIAHYRAFLDDEPDTVQPDEEEVYLAALDFLLRSLKRELSSGERLLLSVIEGLSDRIERAPEPDTSDLVDQRVTERVDHMRRTRFFRSADTQTEAARLAGTVIDGQFRGATPAIKVFALAWCVRIAAFSNPDAAKAWLEQAQIFVGDPSEVLLIARAFVAAQDDWRAALGLLNPEQSRVQATAAFQIMRHGLGTVDALDRAQQAGLGMPALDSDGRCALLASLVETRRWSEAIAATEALDSADYEANPALLWIAASVLVASCLPAELRPIVLHDIPNNPLTCPLREDPAALEAQRTARALADTLAERCDTLNLPREAAAARRYALWLRLVDPDQPHAREELRQRFDDPRSALAYLPLALAFGLEVDRDSTAKAIEKRFALDSAPSPETVNALVALLIDQAMHAPKVAAALLDTYRATFEDYLDPKSLFALETRILVDAGHRNAARRKLEAAPFELGEAERALLESLIDGEEDQPSLAALEAMYRQDPQPGTLVMLVNRYRGREVTPRYLELARKLLEEMPTTEFASEIIGYLVEHGHDNEAAELLDLVSELIERSDTLSAHAAWLHFRRGELARAQSTLARLEARRDEATDRALRLQLIVASGRWEELDGYLDRQWQNRASRSPIELARCSTLAAQIGANRVIEFAKAAIAAAPGDPQVFVAAYTAATTAGIEEDIAEAPGWLMQAAALSNEEGPVHTASIEQLLELNEDWEERSEAATQALVSGSAPLGIVAAMVSRPWLELHLAPLVANPTERDPRRCRLRAPFSGRRRIEPGEQLAAGTIAIDASALVTLAVVDALDALQAFDRIFVAHDLLGDLFEQRSRLSFHQPSRVTFARRLLEMVANDAVRPFRPTSVPDLTLVTDLGLNRAALLSEAASQPDGQHVFVHPFPIRKVGSLLADPVSLDDYSAHLCSCSAVLGALRRSGQVTAAEAARAQGYLDQHEQSWPDEPVIAPGAVLYLSDLAVAYFRYIGLLEKISAAGMTVIVSDSELEQARAMRANATLSDAVDRIITRLRTVVEAGLADGRIVPVPAPRSDERQEASLEALLSLVSRAPVFVTDDRFLNRHLRFDHEGGSTRVLASIDILQLLRSSGRFDEARLGEMLIDLRRRGATFVPVSADGLMADLEKTVLSPGPAGGEAASSPMLQETGELRALRQNIRLIQAHGWYDPAHDTAWLVDLQAALVEAMMAQFTSDIANDLSRARANWLYALLDSRDWSESLVNNELSGIAEYGLVLDHARMIEAAFALEAEAAKRFVRWLEDDVLTPLWTREPRLKDLLINHLRGYVRSIARDMHADGVGEERLAAAVAFQKLPEFLQLLMLGDTDFQDAVGFTLESRAEMGDATFIRGDFIDQVRELYGSPGQSLTMADEQGRTWTLRTDPGDPHWPLLLEREGAAMRLRGLPGIHPDAAVRVAMLDALLAEKSIAASAVAEWRDRLRTAPLAAEDIEALEQDLSALPPLVVEAIGASFETTGAPISLLVPVARAYWEHLAGTGDADTLAGLLTDWDGPAGWFAGDKIERASWALLLASHPRVLSGAEWDLDPGQWRELGKWALGDGDVLAMAAFVELALPRACEDEALESLVLALAAHIEALDPQDEAGPLFLFSSLAIFVEGELSRSGTIADWPPWRRRMAAMAHAALLARATRGQIDTVRFSRFCLDQRGWRYTLQTLVDMRREPRWRSEYMSGSQLRNELLGRIFNAAGALPRDRLTPRLEAALLAEEDSLRARLAIPMALLPGPLEGAIADDLQEALPTIVAATDEALAQETLDLGLIRRLINIEGLMRLPRDLCERANQRIRADGARLLSALPAEDVKIHLLGLANLAASHRQPDLTETVRTLARLHRTRERMVLGEEMQLALHAAAAHEDHQAWSDFLASWVREVAYRTDDANDAQSLHAWLDGLCEIDPQLRTRTGRARAIVRLALNE